MKYYKICRKLLGDDIFEELVSNLVKKISIKFTEEISIETLVKILEINISTILLIAISEVVRIDKNKITIPESKHYLIEENIDILELEYKKYIELLKEKINNLSLN